MPEGSISKLTLATLPRQILEQIILDPVREGLISVEEISEWNNGDAWLPIHPNVTRAYVVNDLKTETARPLRALAQTCQSLRAFTLPLLWAVLDISSVEELGRVRDTLRATPSIAKFVRSFSIRWHMNGDFDKLEPYGTKEDTLHDLAFRNRRSMFHELREKFGCEQGEGGQGAFYHADERYPVLEDGSDGNGEDKRIKSAKDYNKSLVEVVGRPVHSRRWAGVRQSRQCHSRCATLSQSFPRSGPCMFSSRQTGLMFMIGNLMLILTAGVPLWEFSGNLTRLSFDFGWAAELKEDAEVEELMEEAVTSAEVPLSRALDTKEDRDTYNLAIACRTVVAAARGGHLRVLNVSRFVQDPFSVRTLLPFWVQLERSDDQKHAFAWQGAAFSLRPLLWHVSANMEASKADNNTKSTVPSSKQGRHLTAQQLQSLQWHFVPRELPRIQVTPWPNDFPPQPVQRYLPWLAADAELAQQVSDAWNALVDQGQVDRAKCPCEGCTGSVEDQPEPESNTESRSGVDLWALALEKIIIGGMEG